MAFTNSSLFPLESRLKWIISFEGPIKLRVKIKTDDLNVDTSPLLDCYPHHE